MEQRVTYILTGASGGLGLEIVQQLSGHERVIGIYNKNRPELREVDGLLFRRVNLLSNKDIKDFVDSIKSDLKRIVFIHSAALSIDGLAMLYEEHNWDLVMNTNIRASMFLIKELIPHMIRNKWGRIINISSIIGERGAVGTVAYSASKTALLGMSRVLSLEYARYGITSNVLTLGYFEMGLMENFSEKDKERIKNRIPSKMFGDVSNIINAIRFITNSDYLNGANITIDGGISA
jgi:NAD(P)-dependent dehydrogenase (short-subunit alcohol dehydrogenase family)